MPKRRKSEPEQQPELSPEATEPQTDTTVLTQEPENGHGGDEGQEPVEEPAKMRVQIEGTAGAVRAAARKVGNTPPPPTPPVATPANDVEVPVDNTDELLANPRNMVVVLRQLPKSIQGEDGRRIRTSVKLPDRYQCPTTRDEIETDVFERFGGYKYKCSIHPATPNGENTMLGAFTIEHPDGVDAPVYMDGQGQPEFVPIPDPRVSPHMSSADPTQRETDQLSKLRDAANRRLERAQARKEALELELAAAQIEAEIAAGPRGGKASVESEEIKKIREENERLKREAETKKTDDRFARMEDMILKLTNTVASVVQGGGAQAKPAEDHMMKFILEKMKSDDARFAELTKALTSKPQGAQGASGTEDFDKMLDRLAKMQTLTGANKTSKLSELENRLIDMSFNRLTGGGDDDDGGEDEGDMEDAVKLAIKQFAPIAKTFVEKKMDQETAANGGSPITQEQIKKIHDEAAQVAVQKIQSDLALQGLSMQVAPGGRLVAVPLQKKPVVPPRHTPPKVIDERRTTEGTVRTIQVKPDNLSKKQAPRPAAALKAPVEGLHEEEGVAHYAEFPGLGENGSVLKAEIPPKPGDMQYDRKRSVNFVLDAIRSEIKQNVPSNEANESYVPSDALDLLDGEILDKVSNVDSGEQLETILSQFGDKAKIDEIKAAGQNEVVKSWLRRIFRTISDHHMESKKAKA